jgi:hypothetical protein
MNEAAKLLGQNLHHGVSMDKVFNQGTYKPTPDILKAEADFMSGYNALKKK